MPIQEPNNLVRIDPDFTVALLLAFIEDQLNAKVQMHYFDIIHIFDI